MNQDKKELELLLMQLIITNGQINGLVDAGLTYVDIHNLIQNYKNKKYIVLIKNKLQLTSLGKIRFNEICRILGKRGLYKYISPDIKNRITPMQLEEIYIPLSIRKR